MILPLHSSEVILENGGGKGANLSRLIRSGYPVPEGFVVCAQAYRQFVAINGLYRHIAALLEQTALDDLGELESASGRIRAWFLEGKLPAGLEEQLAEAYAALGSPSVAVRSSATAEDLPELSFAGQQDTYLNVLGRAALQNALRRCWGSLWTARAIGYRARNQIAHDELALAVVVQCMLECQASGVLFTANPLSGLRSQAVIDASFGLGEALVSGQVEPDHYVVQRDAQASGLCIVEKRLGSKSLVIHSLKDGGTQAVQGENRQLQALPDDAILELAALGWQVAETFGVPQDIEWGWLDGKLHLLQSRPITSLYPLPDGMTAEPLHVLISFGAMQGMLDPMTPFGQDGISLIVVAVSKMLGFPRTMETQGAFLEAGERIYINLTPLLRNKLGRKAARVGVSIAESGTQEILDKLLTDPRLSPAAHTFSPQTAPKFARLILPTLARMLRTLLAPEMARRNFISAADSVLSRFRHQAQDVTLLCDQLACVQEIFDVVVRLMFKRAIPTFAPGIGMLTKLNGLAAALPGGAQLVLELTRGMPNNVTTEMDLKLWQVARTIQTDPASATCFQGDDAAELSRLYQAGSLPAIAQTQLKEFLHCYGIRGVAEVDIGRMRWQDDPTPMIEALLSYLRIDDPSRAPDQTFARGAQAAQEALEKLVAQLRQQPGGWFKARQARFAAHRVRALSGMREYPKFIAVSMMGMVRPMLLNSGESLVDSGLLDQAGDIFYLRFRELQAIASSQHPDRRWDSQAVSSQFDLRSLVAERKMRFAREKLRRQVPRLLLSDGRAFYEGISTKGDSLASRADPNLLPGMPVSPGVVEGRVRVVLNPHQANLQPGEILVCPGTDPAWTPLFLAAGGLVMEVGGMMTHGSVVAREYGIPAVVGVSYATRRLQTGQLIRLDGNTGKIILLKE